AGGQVAWPGKQYGHGFEGYWQWIVEVFDGNRGLVTSFAPVFEGRLRLRRNDRCSCGSGKKYKRCHIHLVDRIHREVAPVVLRTLFRNQRSMRIVDGAEPRTPDSASKAKVGEGTNQAGAVNHK